MLLIHRAVQNTGLKSDAKERRKEIRGEEKIHIINIRSIFLVRSAWKRSANDCWNNNTDVGRNSITISLGVSVKTDN